jgi:hypothetical protein
VYHFGETYTEFFATRPKDGSTNAGVFWDCCGLTTGADLAIILLVDPGAGIDGAVFAGVTSSLPEDLRS